MSYMEVPAFNQLSVEQLRNFDSTLRHSIGFDCFYRSGQEWIVFGVLNSLPEYTFDNDVELQRARDGLNNLCRGIPLNLMECKAIYEMVFWLASDIHAKTDNENLLYNDFISEWAKSILGIEEKE